MQFPVDLLCGIPVAEPSRQTVSEKFSDDVARETNDGSDENDEDGCEVDAKKRQETNMRESAVVAHGDDTMGNRRSQRFEQMRDENGEEEANDFADDARMVLERPPDQLVAPVMKRVAFFQKCSCVLQVRAQEIYKPVYRLSKVCRQTGDALGKLARMREADELLLELAQKISGKGNALQVQVQRKAFEESECWCQEKQERHENEREEQAEELHDDKPEDVPCDTCRMPLQESLLLNPPMSRRVGSRTIYFSQERFHAELLSCECVTDKYSICGMF